MLARAFPLVMPEFFRNLPEPPPMEVRGSPSARHLNGRRVLVVEDDCMLAMDLEESLLAVGAEVLGPVPDLCRAFETLDGETIDGAILDVQLRGETVYPLADHLRDRGVAFLLVTGVDVDDLPPRHAGAPIRSKPLDMTAAVTALGWLMDGHPGPEPADRHGVFPSNVAEPSRK